LDSISIIIPVYNEADNIGSLVQYLAKNDNNNLVRDIIVVDGGSSDETCEKARDAGATVIPSDRPGRAIQMNNGANYATGDILYFVHADSYPPSDFAAQIVAAWQNGKRTGGFRLRFDTRHWLLNGYAWFTRFSFHPFRYGDQSLYIDRALFYHIGGFREDHIVMEDNEIIRRIMKYDHYEVLQGYITTSARKYIDNGIFRLQLIFTCIYSMYYLGFSQSSLVRFYKTFVRNGKKPVVDQISASQPKPTHQIHI